MPSASSYGQLPSFGNDRWHLPPLVRLRPRRLLSLFKPFLATSSEYVIIFFIVALLCLSNFLCFFRLDPNQIKIIYLHTSEVKWVRLQDWPQRISGFWPFLSGYRSPKKVGEDIAKATSAWKGLRMTVQLTLQSRQAALSGSFGFLKYVPYFLLSCTFSRLILIRNRFLWRNLQEKPSLSRLIPLTWSRRRSKTIHSPERRSLLRSSLPTQLTTLTQRPGLFTDRSESATAQFCWKTGRTLSDYVKKESTLHLGALFCFYRQIYMLNYYCSTSSSGWFVIRCISVITADVVL